MKKKIIKLSIFIIVVIICLGMICFLFPIMKNISTREGQILFKEKIKETGIVGMFLLFLLELAQMFFIILPGEPLEVLAGMCYGAIGGTIFVCVSVFITTALVIFLVKKFGKKIIYEVFPKEKIDKIEKSKIFQNKTRLESILIILFAIPGSPKDLLIYIGGILPISSIKFILISTFARFPSVISSTLVRSKSCIWKLEN